MKKILTAGLLGMTLCTSAFSQVGKVGINTTAPAAMLHVMDSSVLFSAIHPLPSNPGPPPLSGAGTRLMWYPDKAAFRSGSVTGTEWDEANIGRYSVATGRNTKANGEYAVAMGWLSEANAISSVAMGFRCKAQGTSSVALGSDSKSLATYAISLGHDLIANGYSGTVVGTFNDTIGYPELFLNPATPLFVVGNGDNDMTRSNAMVVRKDGRMGLGTNTPLAQLHVEEKSVLFRGPSTLPDPAEAPPVSGAGTRMMWYVDKAAFRAGEVYSTQWNKDSIGLHSIAAGFNAIAKGPGSVSLGSNTKATGVNSVAMGSFSKATGDYATAMGSSTFATGDYSIAIGDGNLASASASVALGNNTTASNAYAVAFGDQTSAIGQGAVASGFSTMAISAYSNAMGGNTVARANYALASGENTTAAGAASVSMGVDTKAKSYACVASGRFNDTTSVSFSSWIDSDPLFIIGNGSANNNRKNAVTVLKNGKMGLGTIAPVNLLQIRALNDTINGPILSLGGTSADQAESGRIRFYEGTSSTNLRGGYIHLDGAANRFHIGIHATSDNIVSNDAPAISIDRASGEVGIGTVNPGYLLEVNGAAGKPGGGSWTNSSDARLKQDIKPYADGLQSILSIHPVRFHYNDHSGYDTSKEYVGVIAQELQEVAPYMVNTSARILPDGSSGYLDVDNSAMTYMLINAVKEQHALITSQQARIDNLEKEMREIRALLEGVTQINSDK